MITYSYYNHLWKRTEWSDSIEQSCSSSTKSQILIDGVELSFSRGPSLTLKPPPQVAAKCDQKIIRVRTTESSKFKVALETKAQSLNGEVALHRGSVCASHPAAPGLNPVSTRTHLVLMQGISWMQSAAKGWYNYNKEGCSWNENSVAEFGPFSETTRPDF